MFEFDLADRLGMSVARLRRRVSNKEFEYWRAWSLVRGLVNREERADLRAARVCATLARVHGNDASLEDYLPKWETREGRRLSDQERAQVSFRLDEKLSERREELQKMRQARQAAKKQRAGFSNP